MLRDEYGLERELVIEAMKDAVRAAARKQFKSEYKGGEGIQVDWNDDEGIVEISAQKTVVEEVESPTTELSLTEAVEMTGDDEIEEGWQTLVDLKQQGKVRQIGVSNHRFLRARPARIRALRIRGAEIRCR